MMHFDLIWPSVPFILGGLKATLAYTFISICCGLVLGLLLAWCKLSHSIALRSFARFYTSIFRGTPLLLQLGIVYFAVPQLTGINIPPFVAGILAFSLNSAAYISEIVRAGIESIDREACLSLNIPEHLTMKDILVPQAFRNVLPSLVNEIVDLLKESALISTMGEADLMRRANMVSAEKFLYFEPLLIAGLCYYILVMIFSALAKYLERRLKHA